MYSDVRPLVLLVHVMADEEVSIHPATSMVTCYADSDNNIDDLLC